MLSHLKCFHPHRAAAGFHRRPISVAGPSFFRRAPRRTLSVRNWLANLFGGEGGGEAPLPSFEEGTFDYVDIPVSDSILAGRLLFPCCNITHMRGEA
eukprot:1373190-Amorphochlora_amoeboformis.AAC.2